MQAFGPSAPPGHRAILNNAGVKVLLLPQNYFVGLRVFDCYSHYQVIILFM